MNRGMFVRSLVFYLAVSVIFVLSVPALALCALFPAPYRYNSTLFAAVLFCMFRALSKTILLPIKFEDEQNVPQESAIIAANHQSALDIPLVGRLCGFHSQIWFFKFELLKLPLLGFIMRRLGVPVFRNSAQARARAVVRAGRLMQSSHAHVVVFPEGERVSDNKVRPFFKGASFLAKRFNRPVVPVRIINACHAYPIGSFLLRYASIRVVVGKPLTYCDGETEHSFNRRLHEWFLVHQG